MGNVGEDVAWRKGGRDVIERVVGEVLVRMGANRGLSGVEEDDVEIGESETEEVEEGGRSVVLRLVGRAEGVRIVIAGEGGVVQWVGEERAVCRLVWVCGLVVGGT